MEGLQFHQFHQFHHQLQVSQMPIAPISSSLSCNLNSIVSKYFSTFRPKLSSSSRVGKIEAIARVSAVELKEQWLNSLSCCPPPLITEMGEKMLEGEVEVGGCGNGEGNIGSSEFVIGIDPDVSGALAVLKTDGSAQVYDSPNVKVLVGNRVRRRLDTQAMVQLLRSLNIPIGTTAYIEQSLPFPADGKQGWWSGGFNYGLWIGVLVASEVSVIPVPSMRWKQEFKLCGNGSTKDDSRALACTLFPTLSSSLRRKKDHGRAEALLIAAYGKGIKLNSESLISSDTEATT